MTGSRRGALAQRVRTLREILTERDLGRLFVTVGLWATVDAAFVLTVTVTAYGLGGAGAVGLVGAARVLPGALTASLATLVADRVPRPRLVSWVSGLGAVVAGLIALSLQADGGLAALLALVALGSAVAGWARPGLQALVPQLVRAPERLLPAGAAWSFLNGLGSVLGPAGAAVLLSAYGPDADLAVLAVLYLATALLAATIRTPFRPPRPPGHHRTWLRGHHLAAGLTPFRAPGGPTFVAVFMVQRLMSGLVTAFVVIYAQEVVQAADPDAVSGVLLAAVGLGGLLGAIGALAFFGRLRWWYAGGVAVSGLGLAGAGLVDRVGPAVVVLAVCGAGSALTGLFGGSILNRWLPDHLAGRAWGILLGVGAVVTALGALVAPALTRALGTGDALVVVGLLAALTPLLSAPGLRVLETRITPPHDLVALLGGTHALASLPGLFLARLACVAVRHEVADGETVVRQGDAGDDFYVVAGGELVVVRDGEEVRRLGPGDTFGEVALLHTVPRTATVTAAAPSTLVSLNHDVFVHIVTGHAPTDAWAESAVSGLLAEDARRTRP